MDIKLANFDDLTSKEAWEIFKLRAETFIVEQEWLACEIDETDLAAQHLIIRNEKNNIIGYLRIYLEDNNVVLGRVIVPKIFRKNNYGKMLVSEGIKFAKKLYSEKDILIHAQEILFNFYESLGFVPCSDAHNHDGILHRYMIIKSKNN